MKFLLITGSALAGVTLLLSACSSDDNASPSASSTQHLTATPSTGNDASNSPMPSGGNGGGSPDGTVVPAPSPGQGASAIPGDWTAHTNAQGGFSVRYPSDWFIADERATALILENLDPSSWKGPSPPAGGTKLDVIVAQTRTMEGRPDGASDLKVGTLSGWYVAYSYDPAKSGGLTTALQAVLINGDSSVSIAEMFIGAAADPDSFWHVVYSFQFPNGSAP